MNGVVRFTREHNRTARDVFNNTIQPKLPLAINDVCQKITYFNRKNHTYQNRTGALENSVLWVPARTKGSKIIAALIAGGPSKALKTFVQKLVFYHDEQGRLRVFEPRDPKIIRQGTPVNVDYAVFVEVKGWPVLKQGVEKYRRQVAAIMAQLLRLKNLPRHYTFKYTGETADIYGG